MRKLAAKIGYTATAIYFHFADKETLIQELVDLDFIKFREQFDGLEQKADPIERIRLMGLAFVSFFSRNPSHFRFLFMTPNLKMVPSAKVVTQGNPAEDNYCLLKSTVEEALAQNRFREELRDSDEICQILMAVVHGVVSNHISHLPGSPSVDRISPGRTNGSECHHRGNSRLAATTGGDEMNRLTAIGLGLFIFAVPGCKKEIEEAREIIRPVKVTQVRYGQTTDRASYTGVVKARYEAELAFRASGKILSRKVELGQRVKAGQVIAELDPQDYVLSMKASEASLAMAEADAKQAIADEVRNRDLVRGKAISPADYDRYRAVADAQIKRVEQAKSQLDISRNKLIYTTLKADHDGVITNLMFEVGKVVAEGTPIVVVSRTDELEAVVAIPENRVTVAQTAKASVELWSDKDRKFAARLRELSPNADPITRTYTARFHIEKPTEEVRLGMTATVHLDSLDVGRQLVTLPLSAVYDSGKGPRVWVVDPKTGKLTSREIRVKEYHQDTILIASGLQVGDHVVTGGTQKLDEGLTVRVVLDKP